MGFNLKGILSLDTSAYEENLKKATQSAKKFSKDSERYVSNAGGKQKVGMEAFGGFEKKTAPSGRFDGLKDALKGSLLARFGPAALGAAALKFGYDVVNVADNVSDMADRLDVSVGAILRVERALAGTGIKIEDVEVSFNKLESSRSDAAAGNEKLRASFERLGVSVEDILDPSVKADKILEKIGAKSLTLGRAGSIGAIGDIFGSKGAAKAFTTATLTSQNKTDYGDNNLETMGVKNLGYLKDIIALDYRQKISGAHITAGVASDIYTSTVGSFGKKKTPNSVQGAIDKANEKSNKPKVEDPFVVKQQADLAAAQTEEYFAQQRAQEALLTTEEKRALILDKINELNFTAEQISGMGAASDTEATKLRAAAADLQATYNGAGSSASFQNAAVSQAQSDTLGAIGGAASGTAYGVNASMEGLTILKELQRVMTTSGVVLRQVKE